MSSKKKVFIHIGVRKTGTTSLQRLLAASHSGLQDRGVLYPKTGRKDRPGPGSWRQIKLYWGLARPEKGVGQEIWDELIAEIEHEKCDTVVLSSEEFQLLDPAHIRAIRSYLRAYDVSVVVYVRKPLALMKSAYKQKVKRGLYAKSFDAFVRDYLFLVDYEVLVGRWEAVFGESALQVRMYDKVRMHGGVEADFGRLVGIESVLASSRPMSRSNVSPSDEHTVLLRYLNKAAAAIPGLHQSHPLVTVFRRRLMQPPNGQSKLRRAFRMVGLLPLISASTAARLEAKTRASNTRFLARYFDAEDHPYFGYGDAADVPSQPEVTSLA